MLGTTDPIRLAGHEVSLRPWHVDDYPVFVKLQQDPTRSKYLLWPVRGDQQLRNVFEERVKQTRLLTTGDYMSLAVVRHGEVIGEVGLFVRSRAHSQLEISWILLSEFRGHGYAQEAATLLIGYAFQGLGARKVVAEIDKRNVTSLRLGLLLGFEIEGIHRDHRFVQGRWTDVYHLGILSSDWKTDD